MVAVIRNSEESSVAGVQDFHIERMRATNPISPKAAIESQACAGLAFRTAGFPWNSRRIIFSSSAHRSLRLNCSALPGKRFNSSLFFMRQLKRRCVAVDAGID